MLRMSVAFVLSATLTLGLGWIYLQRAGATEPTSHITCQEDDPCWDCSTMGNLICGPEQTR